MMQDLFRPFTCKEIALGTLLFGVVNIAATWSLFFAGMYAGALVSSGVGNILTWASYFELQRRRNNG